MSGLLQTNQKNTFSKIDKTTFCQLLSPWSYECSATEMLLNWTLSQCLQILEEDLTTQQRDFFECIYSLTERFDMCKTRLKTVQSRFHLLRANPCMKFAAFAILCGFCKFLATQRHWRWNTCMRVRLSTMFDRVEIRVTCLEAFFWDALKSE